MATPRDPDLIQALQTIKSLKPRKKKLAISDIQDYDQTLSDLFDNASDLLKKNPDQYFDGRKTMQAMAAAKALKNPPLQVELYSQIYNTVLGKELMNSKIPTDINGAAKVVGLVQYIMENPGSIAAIVPGVSSQQAVAIENFIYDQVQKASPLLAAYDKRYRAKNGQSLDYGIPLSTFNRGKKAQKMTKYGNTDYSVFPQPQTIYLPKDRTAVTQYVKRNQRFDPESILSNFSARNYMTLFPHWGQKAAQKIQTNPKKVAAAKVVAQIKIKDSQLMKQYQAQGKSLMWDANSNKWSGTFVKDAEDYQTNQNNLYYKSYNKSSQILKQQLSTQQQKKEIPRVIKQITRANNTITDTGFGPRKVGGLPLYVGRWIDPSSGRIRILPQASLNFINPLSKKQKLGYYQAKLLNYWNQFVQLTQQYYDLLKIDDSAYQQRVKKSMQASLDVPGAIMYQYRRTCRAYLRYLTDGYKADSMTLKILQRVQRQAPALLPSICSQANIKLAANPSNSKTIQKLNDQFASSVQSAVAYLQNQLTSKDNIVQTSQIGKLYVAASSLISAGSTKIANGLKKFARGVTIPQQMDVKQIQDVQRLNQAVSTRLKQAGNTLLKDKKIQDVVKTSLQQLGESDALPKNFGQSAVNDKYIRDIVSSVPLQNKKLKFAFGPIMTPYQRLYSQKPDVSAIEKLLAQRKLLGDQQTAKSSQNKSKSRSKGQSKGGQSKGSKSDGGSASRSSEFKSFPSQQSEQKSKPNKIPQQQQDDQSVQPKQKRIFSNSVSSERKSIVPIMKPPNSVKVPRMFANLVSQYSEQYKQSLIPQKLIKQISVGSNRQLAAAQILRQYLLAISARSTGLIDWDIFRTIYQRADQAFQEEEPQKYETQNYIPLKYILAYPPAQQTLISVLRAGYQRVAPGLYAQLDENESPSLFSNLQELGVTSNIYNQIVNQPDKPLVNFLDTSLPDLKNPFGKIIQGLLDYKRQRGRDAEQDSLNYQEGSEEDPMEVKDGMFKQANKLGGKDDKLTDQEKRKQRQYERFIKTKDRQQMPQQLEKGKKAVEAQSGLSKFFKFLK